MKPLMFYRIKDIFLNIGSKWDKLSPPEDEAIAFAHEFINPEPAKYISSDELSRAHILSHYGELYNPIFREGRNTEDDDCKSLFDMVEANQVKRDVVVYRGVDIGIFEQMKKNAKNKDGIDLLDKGFLYTSLVKGNEAKSFCQLRIFVPKGTSAVYSGNVNDEQFWYEVVVQCGTPLKVISADKEYINCVVLQNV